MRWSIASPPAASHIRVPTLAGLGLAALAAVWILTQPFPANLALAPAIALGLALLLIPAVAPIALVASVPIQTAGALSLGGIELTATKLALAAAVGAVAIHLLTRREALRGSILLVPYLAYLGAMILSLWGARDLNAGLAEIYRWVVTLFAFLLVLHSIRTRKAILAVPVVISLGVLLESAGGVIQSLLSLGPASFAVQAGLSRAFGTFGKPNSYAGYLEMTGPLLFAFSAWGIVQLAGAMRAYRQARPAGMQASQTARHQLVGWTAFTAWISLGAIASVGGIALSFSRGAWLGAAAAAVAMLLVSARRVPVIRVAILVIGTLFLIGGGMRYAPAAVQDRYEQLVGQVRLFDSREVTVTGENFAAVERMEHWQTGVGMFKAYPLTGVGIGNFNARYRDFYVHPGFPRSEGHAHNYYIHALAETGMVGLGTYLAMIGTALVIAVRAARQAPDGLGRALGVGAVGVTIAVMVHNVVEDLHVLNLGIQLSAVWALAVIGLRYPPATDARTSLERTVGTP